MVSFDIMYYNTIAYSSRGGVMTHSQQIRDLLSFNCFQLLNENIPFETYEIFFLNLQIYVPVCLFLFSKTTIINNLVHKCSIQPDEKQLQVCMSWSENIRIDNLENTVPFVLKSYNLLLTKNCSSFALINLFRTFFFLQIFLDAYIVLRITALHLFLVFIQLNFLTLIIKTSLVMQ